MKKLLAIAAAFIVMASCNTGGGSKQDANANQGGTSDTGNTTLGSVDTTYNVDTSSGVRTTSGNGSDTIGMEAGSSGVVDSSLLKKP